MKKILLLIAAFAVIALTGQSQIGIKKTNTKKSFITLNAGPAFPTGDFGSTNENNENAGYANIGFNINAHYIYHLQDHFGIAANGFYTRFSMDKSVLQGVSGANIDHWQYYGLGAGPLFYTSLDNGLYGDFRVTGGIANVNSPKMAYHGETVVSEDWGIAGVIQAAVDARIMFGNNAFIFTNAEYIYMKPTFKVASVLSPDPIKVKQEIAAINLSVGIGINF